MLSAAPEQQFFVTRLSHACGTILERGIRAELGLRGFGWFINVLFWADNTLRSLSSVLLRTHPIARLVMLFTVCLFATAAVLPSAVNGSPATTLPSLFEPWTEGLNSLWQKPSLNAGDSRQLEKRQSTAFDRNPNGSEFLWVLEDTYQGKTFFECVAV